MNTWCIASLVMTCWQSFSMEMKKLISIFFFKLLYSNIICFILSPCFFFASVCWLQFQTLIPQINPPDDGSTCSCVCVRTIIYYCWFLNYEIKTDYNTNGRPVYYYTNLKNVTVKCGKIPVCVVVPHTHASIPVCVRNWKVRERWEGSTRQRMERSWKKQTPWHLTSAARLCWKKKEIVKAASLRAVCGEYVTQRLNE